MMREIFLGAPPHTFTHQRLLQDDGALSHPPAFTWRRRAVRSNAACVCLFLYSLLRCLLVGAAEPARKHKKHGIHCAA